MAGPGITIASYDLNVDGSVGVTDFNLLGKVALAVANGSDPACCDGPVPTEVLSRLLRSFPRYTLPLR